MNPRTVDKNGKMTSYLSLGDAARESKQPAQRIHLAMKNGELPYDRIGNWRWIKLSDLIEWMESHT